MDALERPLGGSAGGEEPPDDYIAEIIRRAVGGDLAVGDSSAPVLLPGRDELTVRLVTQHSLDRLRDAEADRTLFDSILWSLVGGVIGFFTNVVTGGQSISAAGYVFIAMLFVAAAGVGALRVRLSRRLKAARRKVE